VNKEKIAIYPGTFDPITYGHLEVLMKASKMFDKLYVGVAVDGVKNASFSAEERVQMIREEIGGADNIIVCSFSGLLVEFARNVGATVLIRGLRAVSDFEYEFQMACMNSRLAPEIQTIFIPSSENMQFVSSRLVKEVFRLGGDVSAFTSKNAQNHLAKYFGK